MNKTDLKRLLILLPLFLPFLITVSFSKKGRLSPEESCRAYVLNNIEKIEKHLYNCARLSDEGTGKLQFKQIKKEYAKIKNAYKQVEFFIEYYSSSDQDPKVLAPLETHVLSKEKIDRVLFKKNVRLLCDKFNILKDRFRTITIERPSYQEALCLQMKRMKCIAPDDGNCTFTKASISEYIHSLGSLRDNITHFQGVASVQQKQLILKLIYRINYTVYFLDEYPHLFDRSHFTIKFLDPLYEETCELLSSFNSQNS